MGSVTFGKGNMMIALPATGDLQLAVYRPRTEERNLSIF